MKAEQRRERELRHHRLPLTLIRKFRFGDLLRLLGLVCYARGFSNIGLRARPQWHSYAAANHVYSGEYAKRYRGVRMKLHAEVDAIACEMVTLVHTY
jgi:hypothetical protein